MLTQAGIFLKTQLANKETSEKSKMKDPVNNGIAALKDTSDTVAVVFDTTIQGKVTYLNQHAHGLMNQYNRQTHAATVKKKGEANLESIRLQVQAGMEDLQEEFDKHQESMIRTGNDKKTKVESSGTTERNMSTQAGIFLKTHMG